MSRTRNVYPLPVGDRRGGRQRYASTHVPTMRHVAQRATVALVGIALTLVSLSWVATSPTLPDYCADIAAGTDVTVPADVADICRTIR